MKLLMIGNSYTFFNDLPQMLENLLSENGIDSKVDSVTKGGRLLCHNLADKDENGEKIRALSAQTAYDALILQEHSCHSLLGYAEFENALVQLTRIVCAKRVILYSTWGRKEGSPTLAEHNWTSEQMADSIDHAYHRAAQVCGAQVSRVGICFKHLTAREPDLELYNPDLTHPSYLGSAIAALCHYKTLIGTLPSRHETLALSNDVYTRVAAVLNEVV